MNKWGDAKRFIFEDIVLYSAVFVINTAYDPLFNLVHAMRLVATSRPVDLGIGQCVVAVAFGLLLMRKVAQWKYYS